MTQASEHLMKPRWLPGHFSHHFGTRALRPKQGAPENPAMPGGIATQPPREAGPSPEAWSGPCLLEDRALTENIRGS